jgi:hypothetical protein
MQCDAALKLRAAHSPVVDLALLLVHAVPPDFVRAGM